MAATYTTFTVVMGQALSASVVFSSMAVFEQLRDVLHTAFYFVPVCIQAKVSLERLTGFLNDVRLPRIDTVPLLSSSTRRRSFSTVSHNRKTRRSTSRLRRSHRRSSVSMMRLSAGPLRRPRVAPQLQGQLPDRHLAAVTSVFALMDLSRSSATLSILSSVLLVAERPRSFLRSSANYTLNRNIRVPGTSFLVKAAWHMRHRRLGFKMRPSAITLSLGLHSTKIGIRRSCINAHWSAIYRSSTLATRRRSVRRV